MEGGTATAARVGWVEGGRGEEGVMGQLLSGINKKSLQIFVKITVCGGRVQSFIKVTARRGEDAAAVIATPLSILRHDPRS